MSQVLLEIIIIILLLVANGVFAMTEIAILSAKKPRLRRLAEQGNARARVALELAESPNRFLSTVPAGITLVGVLAGAYGGATIADQLTKPIAQIMFLAPFASEIALGIVVLAITYCSLVIGELVPKRIALGNPEGVSLRMARFMNGLSLVASPLVKFLSASTEAPLRLFGVKPAKVAAVSEEEVTELMQEGLRAGAFHRVESQIVHSALELDRLAVREIMTPRSKIIWLNKDDSHDAVWHKIVVSAHSNFPVYEGNRDYVVGVVSVKAVYANLAAGVGVKLADLMNPALFAPATQNVLQLLETFKHSGRHIALVTDEFGGIVGLVTLHDVMEAVLGDLLSLDERAQPAAKKRDDGTWLIDAMMEIEKVERALPGLRLSAAAGKDYQTLAGFVVKRLGHLPKEGETFEDSSYVFEVLDMDRHRVDKVLVTPAKPSGPQMESQS